MWNEKSELSDGLYFVSDIQYYFDYIIKKHETVTDNFSIRIYVNKIENRITFKNKNGIRLNYVETLKATRLKMNI